MTLRPNGLPVTALLTALVALGPLSTDLYLPSLPGMARSFSAPVAEIQLTLSVFLVGLALGQLAYGPLSDRFGRRPVLLVGLALYGLASLACLLAPGIGLLIVLRFLQALGGCAGPVICRAVVRDVHGRDGALGGQPQHREIGIAMDQLGAQHLAREGDRAVDVAHQQVDRQPVERAPIVGRRHPGFRFALLHHRFRPLFPTLYCSLSPLPDFAQIRHRR